MIKLTEKSIGDKGAKDISEALIKLTNLKNLDIYLYYLNHLKIYLKSSIKRSLNSIGDNAAEHIYEALKKLTNLNILNINILYIKHLT
jgi:hypothetical protein